MELNNTQRVQISQATWMLASTIQNLSSIEHSPNAADWLEAAKRSIAKAMEQIVSIEL